MRERGRGQRKFHVINFVLNMYARNIDFRSEKKIWLNSFLILKRQKIILYFLGAI